MKLRDMILCTLILALCAACGLKRNLELPDSKHQQDQTNQSSSTTSVPSITPVSAIDPSSSTR